jgi:hypothetical protein
LFQSPISASGGNIFGTPNFDSPLTYLGVLLLTVGIYITLSGFGILKIEKYTTPEGVKSWGAGLILVLLGLGILFILPTYQTDNGYRQEVGILKCQNNLNTGLISSQNPIVLSWGWATDSQEKRDEAISLSSFVLTLDGKTQDTNKADRVLNSTDTVY